MEELRGKRVLVLGLGRSGRSAAAFCAERGARVLAVDERALESLDLDPRVELRTGVPFPDPADFDLVIPSPGVPAGRYAGARLALGDVELAARALRVPIVAVTGTNGKSTSVRLIEALLRAAGLRARAAGNVGEPALGLVGEALDVAVLEVSSFQLESVDRFHPRVAVLLNVTEDHVDRHGSFEAYAAAKARIFARQGPDDVAVLNGDDPVVMRLAETTPAQRQVYTRSRPVPEGGWWDAGSLLLGANGARMRLPVEPDWIANRSVRENLLPALLAARAVGADPRRALAALPDFAPLPHRLEPIARVAGVLYVNDSKATNPGAAMRALEAQDAPVIWLAGGRDKGLGFDALAEVAARRARHAILFGEAAEKLAVALGTRLSAERAPDLEAALALAAAQARPGDVVLLAPACASFDQFASFEERGECFRAGVERLAEAAR